VNPETSNAAVFLAGVFAEGGVSGATTRGRSAPQMKFRHLGGPRYSVFKMSRRKEYRKIGNNEKQRAR